jgi:hypothetical protein
MTNKKWVAPTKEQGQILALTAQIEKLQFARKPEKSQQQWCAPRTKTKHGSDSPSTGNEWAWKEVLPKEGEPTPKSFAGKTYHFACKYHPNQWVCHTAQECSKNPANTDESHGNDGPSSNKKRLKAAKLAVAILEEDDGEDLAEQSEGDDH